MVSVALFVTGSSLGLAVYLNLRTQLVDTTPPENILVLATGAVSERGSRLDLEAARKVALLDGVKKDGDAPLATQELLASVYVNTSDLSKYDDPVTIRGIDERSLKVHRVTLIEGSLPEPGTLQVMVGKRLAKKFASLKSGSDLFLPGGASRVIGVFEADGSPFEDEVWTQRAALEVHLNQKFSSSTTLVAESAGRVPEIVDKINKSKEYEAHAVSVASYQAAGAGLATILRTVLILLTLLSVVATSAIATTMSAAVASRMPELAAMVAIGIRRGVLARMVIVESALLAVVGALVGVLASELIRRSIGTLTLGATPVELTAKLSVPLLGLALGLFVGLIGGLAPSIAVRRLDIIRTLR